MRRQGGRFLLATIVGVSTFMALPSRADDEGPEEVSVWSAVVTRNWTAWSNGRDAITKVELIARIAQPEYRDEDAAALVALELYLRKVDSIDRDTAINLRDERIIDAYLMNVRKLRAAPRSLYATGRPSFDALRQGPAGDCYFFAGTGWMAKYRKEIIMRAIEPLPDNTYRVTFPNGDRAQVSAPTDAELAFNDSPETLQDGLWMPILEKATGAVQQLEYRQSASIPDPTVAIDVSGIPITSIVERWTGHPVVGVHLGTNAKKGAVRLALRRMQERHSVAEVLLLKKPAARLMYKHVYAVLAYDDERELLTIWNPHGQDFTPQGISGPDNGYETRHGVFHIPLNEFIAFFTYLAIEQN